MMKQETGQTKVRFSIGAKLVTIISILIIISLGGITALVTWFGRLDVQLTAEENNRTVNKQAASSAEKDLTALRANASLLLDILNTNESASSFSNQVSSLYFEKKPYVAAILVTDSNRAAGIEKNF